MQQDKMLPFTDKCGAFDRSRKFNLQKIIAGSSDAVTAIGVQKS